MNKKINLLYYMVGTAVVGAFLFTLYILAFIPIPPENKDLFLHMTGVIDAAFVGGLVGTFFGGSKKDHDPGTSTETETKTETTQP